MLIYLKGQQSIFDLLKTGDTPQPAVHQPHWACQKTDPTCCNATVYARWRLDVIGHQCTRKKVVEIEGVGFCKMHAKRYQP
jgi:hypothetical protein